MAEPPCRPPSLALSVHGARAQVSSLWALPCPLPGVSDPLGGADALPCPSSPGDSKSCGNKTSCGPEKGVVVKGGFGG